MEGVCDVQKKSYSWHLPPNGWVRHLICDNVAHLTVQLWVHNNAIKCIMSILNVYCMNEMETLNQSFGCYVTFLDTTETTCRLVSGLRLSSFRYNINLFTQILNCLETRFIETKGKLKRGTSVKGEKIRSVVLKLSL